MKKTIHWLLTALIAFLVPFILGEAVIRLYLHFIYGQRYTILDQHLGWRATENYIFQGIKYDAQGQAYPAKVTTNKDGFRLYGDISTERTKILVLGDSFTQALSASDDKTYYHYLQNPLNAEVFAYGTGGYGTLQEYMILQKYLHVIKPDIILLQYCSNDFVNNHYPLELAAYPSNNHKRRPYLDGDGNIVYRLPTPFPSIRDWINHNSLFLYFVVTRIEKMVGIYTNNKESDADINTRTEYPPFFQQSLIITDKLLAKIRAFVPLTTRVYAFSSDAQHPYYHEFRRLSIYNKIHFIDGIPEAVTEAEQAGIVIREADGGHWSEMGHKIVAEKLIQYFIKENIADYNRAREFALHLQKNKI